MNKLKTYREFIILAVIALVLLAYIIFRSSGNINYKLPEIDIIDKDSVSSLTIDGQEASYIFEKDGDDWYIQPENWLANASTVNTILNSLTEIKVVDLISSSGNPALYDLSEDKRFTVKAYSGDEMVRELYVGKVSSSGVYTYIMFPGDGNVYSIRGSLPSSVGSGKEDMREKQIIKVQKSDLQKMTFTSGGATRILYKDENELWTEDSAEVQPDADLIAKAETTLTSLRSTKYLSEKPAGEPEWTVGLSTGDEDISLQIWPATEDGYPAWSSIRGYSFIISAYSGESILKGFGMEFSEE